MNKPEAKKQFRMSWKNFVEYIAMWDKNQKLHPDYAAYTSFEESSGIYSAFGSYEQMIRSRTLSPQAKKEGLDKAIEGLIFLKGIPGILVGLAAARTLSRKRGGLKPQRKWHRFRVIYDEHGALVLPKEEIGFDMELSDKVLVEYQEALEKQREREAKEEAEKKDEESNTDSTDGSGEGTESADKQGEVVDEA